MLLLFLLLFQTFSVAVQPTASSIAIIGAGIGSAAFVHFFNTLISKENETNKERIEIKLDIYEKNETIGGRFRSIHLTNIEDAETAETAETAAIEIGCPLFASSDRLLLELMNIDGLNLSIKKHKKTHGQRAYAVFDMNNNIENTEMQALKTHSYFHSLFNYGIRDTFLFRSLLSQFQASFSKIYPFLWSKSNTNAKSNSTNSNVPFFESLADMLEYLKLENETQTDCHSYFHYYVYNSVSSSPSMFHRFRKSSDILDSYLLSLMRMTNGLHSHTQAFACLYSISKLFTAEYFWSVKGGNQKLVERIFALNANTNVNMNMKLSHKVNKIEWNERAQKYRLQYEQIDEKSQIPISLLETLYPKSRKKKKNINAQKTANEYDYVIIATPLELASIRKSNDWKFKISSSTNAKRPLPLIEYPFMYITILYCTHKGKNHNHKHKHKRKQTHTTDTTNDNFALNLNPKFFFPTETKQSSAIAANNSSLRNMDELLMASFDDEMPWFNSIQKVELFETNTNVNATVNGNENSNKNDNYCSHLYRIYSTNLMIPAVIRKLFDLSKRDLKHKHFHIHRFVSNRSPNYKNTVRSLAPINLDENQRIFYINAIDSVASAAELSVISAKNIANYLYATIAHVG